jgi:hypothetical protein
MYANLPLSLELSSMVVRSLSCSPKKEGREEKRCVRGEEEDEIVVEMIVVEMIVVVMIEGDMTMIGGETGNTLLLQPSIVLA